MNTVTSHQRTGWRRLLVAGAAGACAAMAGVFLGYRALVAQRQAQPASGFRRTLSALIEAARAEPSVDMEQVPAAKVEAYVRVYAAMQRDHSLSIERAAMQQGLSVGALREIEEKIEHDGELRRRVRKLLVEAAKHPDRTEGVTRHPALPSAGN